MFQGALSVWHLQNLVSAKTFPKCLMPRQKTAQKPNEWASFHELYAIECQNQNFKASRLLFVTSFIKYYIFSSTIAKSLRSRQNLPLKT